MNWAQLRAIFWLRSRLNRNLLRRGGKLNLFLVMLVKGLLAALAVAGLAGGFLIAWIVFPGGPEWMPMVVWDAVILVFLFLWLIGLMVEVQRSESIDLRKLLHLPLSLQQVFFFNYVASLASFLVLLVLAISLGLVLGETLRNGPISLLQFPVVLSGVFLVSACSYWLRGWLSILMFNPRRRRSVLVIIAVSAVLLGQIPNLLLNNPYTRARRDAERKERRENPSVPSQIVEQARKYHLWVPLLWAGGSHLELKSSRPAWPLAMTALMTLAGVGALARAYRGTLAFYLGESDGKPRAARLAGPRRRHFMEWRLRGFSEEVSALALAQVQSMLRATEMKMALIGPLVMLVLLVTMQGGSRAPSGVWLQPLAASAATGAVVMGFLQVVTNLFGFDRDGFRALVLSPVDRRDILLAKNLSMAPLVLGSGLVVLVVIALFSGLGLQQVLMGVAVLFTAFFWLCLVGNFVSIRAPYRIASGSLQPSKMGAKAGFLLFGTYLLSLVCLVPLALPAVVEIVSGLLGLQFPIAPGLLAALALLAPTAACFPALLRRQGEWLQQREQEILRVVTSEME